MPVFRRFLCVMALPALAACATEYTYTPPPTESGRVCAAQCQVTQQGCRGREDSRAADAQDLCLRAAESNRAQCDHDADIEYGACLKYSRSDKDRNACKRADCTQGSCYESSSYGLCDSDYRACYQTCGGQVGILK